MRAWNHALLRRRGMHSKTRLDSFVTSFDHRRPTAPPSPVSNSLLSYAISEALKNLLPVRLTDDYAVNFSSSSAQFLVDSPSSTPPLPAPHDGVLGEGRFGVVRRATELATGKVRAVKTQKKKHMRRDPVSGGFFEVEVMERLPKGAFRLVKVYETPLRVHIVTELLEGPNFLTYWDQKFGWETVEGVQQEQIVASHVRQCVTPLLQCAQAGYAHNDVKFENFMFRDERCSELLLIDFGSARPLAGNLKLRERLGSPSYASPEVLREARFTETSDAWSLGVMAHAMLTGFFPPLDEDSGEVEFDEEDWEDVSSEAQSFTRSLLVEDPRRRMTLDEAVEHPFVTRKVVISHHN